MRFVSCQSTTTMTIGLASQPSSTSLSRYATAKSPGVDLYNGSQSREFCNSFWGGDAGVNVLFARMRGAARTAEELRTFWRDRAAIEEEYAHKLMELSHGVLGKDEIGEVRSILDTVKLETEKMAQAHVDLTQQIRTELEGPAAALLAQHAEHRRAVQAPLEKKFKLKQMQESYVAKAREKYASDCLRITSYSKQIEVSGKDQERLQAKLGRARQTVQANEKDYQNFIEKLRDMEAEWELEWKGFCDDSQDLEEDRMDFLKDNLWTYANAVSTVCVADDLSCEAIRTVLDHFEGEKHIENFVNEYGTGNTVTLTPAFEPQSDPTTEPKPVIKLAEFSRTRKTGQQRRPLMANSIIVSTTSTNGTSSGPSTSAAPPPTQAPPPPKQQNKNLLPPSRSGTIRRSSQPLPEQPVIQGRDPVPSPRPPEHLGGGILFYVKALYDYTATIDEEFDFQAGDIIAVTATPEDGWWSGELLDEARREEGRHIFPSNFVCLF